MVNTEAANYGIVALELNIRYQSLGWLAFFARRLDNAIGVRLHQGIITRTSAALRRAF